MPIESVVGVVLGMLILVVGFLLDNLNGRQFWRTLITLVLVAAVSIVIALVMFNRVVSRRLDAFDSRASLSEEQIRNLLQAELREERIIAQNIADELHRHAGEFSRRIELLRSELQLTSTKLIVDPALAEIERMLDVQEVWIITDELLVELGGRKDPLYDFIDIMTANLERGVKYTYILPDRVHLQNRVENIRNQFNRYLDNSLIFAVLSEDHWSRLPVSQGEYLIYGPHRGQETQVYFHLPVERRPRIRQWIRVSPDLHDFWVGQTAFVVNQARKPHLKVLD